MPYAHTCGSDFCYAGSRTCAANIRHHITAITFFFVVSFFFVGSTVSKHELVERASIVFRLHVEHGWDFHTIAERLTEGLIYGGRHVQYQCTWQQCKNDYNRILDAEAFLPSADEVQAARQDQLARCQMLKRALTENASKGDVSSVHAYIRVLEHEAKLLGLNQPQYAQTGTQPLLVALGMISSEQVSKLVADAVAPLPQQTEADMIIDAQLSTSTSAEPVSIEQNTSS